MDNHLNKSKKVKDSSLGHSADGSCSNRFVCHFPLFFITCIRTLTPLEQLEETDHKAYLKEIA